MVSHKSLGGLDVSIGKGGLRFKKRAGAGQRCVGAHMKGTHHTSLPAGMGGRYDKVFQGEFYDAAKACGFNVTRPRPA